MIDRFLSFSGSIISTRAVLILKNDKNLSDSFMFPEIYTTPEGLQKNPLTL